MAEHVNLFTETDILQPLIYKMLKTKRGRLEIHANPLRFLTKDFFI